MKSLSAILSVFLVLSFNLHAGPIPDVAHSLSIEDLRTEVSARNSERAGHIRAVQNLLRHPEVQKTAHLFDLEKIVAAVPKLDDATLARIADESARMNERFQAGQRCCWNRRTILTTVVITIAITVLMILITSR